MILDVEEVPIKIPNWDSKLDGLKVAVVGDIHAGMPFFEDRRVRKIVDKINSLKPDIVLLVGDYVNGGWYQSAMDLKKLGGYLGEIKAPLGAYAILGNHDYLYGAGEIRKMINSTGIKLLENSNAKVKTPKGDFYVSGIADPLSADYSYSQALGGIEKNAPVIFLSHTPDVFREIPSEVGVTFSGHTHGGQVRLPFIGALHADNDMLPRGGWFPAEEYLSGLHEVNATYQYVSTGLGAAHRTPFRFRLWNTPQISLIKLTRKLDA